jgi:hypothetical protein
MLHHIGTKTHEYKTGFHILDEFVLLIVPRVPFLLGNLDRQLTKVLLIPHVLIRLLKLAQPKHLAIHHGLDIIRLNRRTHILHLQSRPDQDAAHSTDIAQAVQERRLLLAETADKSNDADDTIDTDSLETLSHGIGSTNFNNMLHTLTTREFRSLLAPIRRLLVVDHMIGSKFLQRLRLLLTRRCRNNARTRRFGKLQCENGHSARSLCEHPLAGLQGAGLEAVECVPRGERGAGECGGFEEVEVRGHGHEALFREGGVFAEGAVDGAAEACGEGFGVERAGDVALVEEGDDFVW